MMERRHIMFTLNDLLDQVDCQGEVKVLVIVD